MRMMSVVVGSRNPGKLGAVQDALVRCQIEAEVRAVPVPSGVADQPMTLEETLRGAKERARAALHRSSADLAVGLEGGIFCVDGEWFEAGWIHVTGSGVEASAPTAGFPVPSSLLPHLLVGRDLNEAVEAELGVRDIGEGAGLTGYLSRSLLVRQDLYTDGVVMALSRYHRPELWTPEVSAL